MFGDVHRWTNRSSVQGRCRSSAPMEQARNPLNYVMIFVGRPRALAGALWLPAQDIPAPWTTGRDKPVPYDRCSSHVRDSTAGSKLSSGKRVDLKPDLAVPRTRPST